MWLTVLVYGLQENNFEDNGKDSQGNAKTVGVICSKLKIKTSVLDWLTRSFLVLFYNVDIALQRKFSKFLEKQM